MCSPFNWVYQFSDVVLINCHEHAALKHCHSIKTTMKYHLTAVRVAVIKKSTNNKCWRRQWHPTPVLLPGKFHGRRSLVGCSPWDHWESDTTERLHFHFSLSRIGEGNGNPLQCSCLEIPGTGEPGGLPSMGSYRVGHDWSGLAADLIFISIKNRIHDHLYQDHV